MMSSKSVIRRLGFGAVAAVLTGLALGADAPTRTVDAGGLTFEVPSSWKSVRPGSSMRRAELRVGPVEGDDDPAELQVFAFPGGAGSVEANITRWQRQFKDADGNPPRITSQEIKGKNVAVTRVETAGHYFPTTFPGQPKQADKPHYRLLGAIVQTDQVAYFLKMVGPEKTMIAARPEFDKMLTTIKAGEK